VRVLLLSQFFAPVIGGEERHVEALAGELLRRGHEVSVATIAIPGEPLAETRDGVRVHRLRTAAQRLPGLFSDPRRPHAPPFPDPELAAGLRRVARLERPDVVHAHNWIAGSALSLRRDAPIVLTLHDYSHACATKRLMLDGAACPGPAPVRCLRHCVRHYGAVAGPVTALGAWAMRGPREAAVSAVIAVSAAVARGSRTGVGIPLHVIPNFIPDRLREDAGEPLDEPFLLFVGDLGRDKGLHTVLDAYRQLAGPPPLVLMGRRVADTPARLPAGVTVRTDCPHDQVIDALRRCRVALAPSVWPDPCPTVVLEAMAAGRALVTTPVGGIPELVGADGAVTVPPGDAGSLAAAVRELLADAGARRRLGASARRRSRAFTASAVVPRIETVYRSCL
jgi:glycosyltransferase involved in cell wall biosynthesis